MPDDGFAGAGNSGGKPYIVRSDPFGNFPCDKVGKCLGKAYDDCNDANACTIDACNATAGCTNVPLDDGKPCDDGDPCTGDGKCASNACKAGDKYAQKTPCDDGNICTASKGLCTASGACLAAAICDDGKPCTADKCDKDGKCTFEAITKGGKCDDGDWCTTETVCDDKGGCAGGKSVCTEKILRKETFPCDAKGYQQGDWADGGGGWNVDALPKVPGYKSAPCAWNMNNDKDYQTTKATRQLQASSNKYPLALDGRIQLRYWSYMGIEADEDATKDVRAFYTYVAGKNRNTNLLSKANHDKNKWAQYRVELTKWRGLGEAHVGVYMRRNGVKNAGAGWFIDDIEVVQIQLADGVPCNFDTDCDDANPCTKNVCSNKRCVNTLHPEGTVCDDGLSCFVDDKCSKEGKCSGAAKDCDDKNPCTVDSCSESSGCLNKPGKEGETCDDGSKCTSETKCVGGSCVGKDACDDGKPCTRGQCDETNGTCKQVNVQRYVQCGGGNSCYAGNCVSQGGARGVIATAQVYSCGAKSDGKAYCWGSNNLGQLGNGTKDEKLAATQVTFSGTFEALSTRRGNGFTTCGIGVVGGVRDVYCWGRNDVQLIEFGKSTKDTYVVPTKRAGTTGALDVKLGDQHACMLTSSGRVGCWGGGGAGQANGSRLTGYLNTTYAPGITNAVAIAAAGLSNCALLADGTVKCWGYNRYGQLGGGELSGNYVPPTQVKGISGVKAVSGGWEHYCAQDSGNNLWCWGRNNHGQLGTGDRVDAKVPVKIATGLNSRAILGMGYRTSCAMFGGEKGSCWGEGSQGELGNGKNNDILTPQQLANPTYSSNYWIRQLGPFFNTPCALDKNGPLTCWGYGKYGMIGDGSKDNRNRPTKVVGW